MYKELTPNTQINNLIDCFWEVSNENSINVITPDGSVDIIFYYNKNNSTVFVNGAMTKPEKVPLNRNERYLGIRLKAGMASQIFSNPINIFSNQKLDIDELGIKKRNFTEILDNNELSLEDFSNYFNQKFNLIYNPNKKFSLSFINELSRIKDGSINNFSDKLGFSSRHFSRIFNEIFGYSPRFYSKVNRLNNLKEMIPKHHFSDLDISGSAGYYDQSHMHRDIKALTGLTYANFKKQHMSETYNTTKSDCATLL